MILINGIDDEQGGGVIVKDTPLTQTELIEKFIARVYRLEKRFEGDDYANSWLVPKDELIAIRDLIERPTLFDL